MIHDAALPPLCASPATTTEERRGVYYAAARWTPDHLAALTEALAEGGGHAYREVPPAAVEAAWQDTVRVFLDPASPERRALAGPLKRFTGLSAAGLEAALEVVLGGVAGNPATDLFRRAGPGEGGSSKGPLLVVLASNLPALAVQPLLPALVLRRPTLLKSPSAEPLFAPAFVRALVTREPRLAPALAAVTWRGGATGLEAPVLSKVERVLAYGERESLEDLESRTAATVVTYGPKISFAALAPGREDRTTAAAVARDVALFDQRGCLSVHAVYTAGDAEALARRLASALEELAHRWPPGDPDPATAAAVHQVRAEADLRGLYRPRLPLRAGTIIVEPERQLRPSPGLRTVRVHLLGDLRDLPGLLAEWSGRLQGAALSGPEAVQLRRDLASLGVSRFAEPGRLQRADALWHNGGAHPLEALR